MNALGKPIYDLIQSPLALAVNFTAILVVMGIGVRWLVSRSNKRYLQELKKMTEITMTENAMESDQGRCLGAGTDDCMATTDAMDFNRNALLDRLSGDMDLATKVVQAFVDETQGLLSAFGQALAREDVYAAQRLAHSIKGSSGSVGCHRLQGVAQHAEDYCRDGRLEDARSADAEFVTAFARVESALQESGFLQ